MVIGKRNRARHGQTSGTPAGVSMSAMRWLACPAMTPSMRACQAGGSCAAPNSKTATIKHEWVMPRWPVVVLSSHDRGFTRRPSMLLGWSRSGRSAPNAAAARIIGDGGSIAPCCISRAQLMPAIIWVIDIIVRRDYPDLFWCRQGLF